MRRYLLAAAIAGAAITAVPDEPEVREVVERLRAEGHVVHPRPTWEAGDAQPASARRWPTH